MTDALLIGLEPPWPLGYHYVDKAPYQAVVIGSLELGQLLCFRCEAVLAALSHGIPVLLYEPGLPTSANRALGAAIASKKRELKSWGVQFTDGAQRRLITAQQAADMVKQGIRPGQGAVLTPLAREILEGKT